MACPAASRPSVRLATLLAALVASSSTGFLPSVQAAPLAPVNTIQGWYSLSTEQAAAGQPVRLRATVLYADPPWHQLFIQDDTGASFIETGPGVPKLQPGDLVEIEGRSLLRDGIPRLANLTVRLAGHGELPPPSAREFKDVLAGLHPGRLVAFPGLVVATDDDDRHLRLSVQVDFSHVAEVYVLNHTAETSGQLLGAWVGITAVNATRLAQPPELRFFTWSDRDIIVWRRAIADPAGLQQVTVKELMTLDPSKLTPLPALERVRVVARVLEHQPGQWLRVADDDGTVLTVSCSQLTQAKPGELLEIVGFPMLVPGQEARLHHADFRFHSSPGPAGATTNASLLPTLTQAQAIRRLSRDEAARAYPVELNAVVTCYDREWGSLFVQDDTAGIFVGGIKPNPTLRTGHRVRVVGRTDPGGYAPMVSQAQVQILGDAPLPEPKRLPLGILEQGGEDSQWVELTGVVHSVMEQEGHLRLQLRDPHGRFDALLPIDGTTNTTTGFLDAKLRLRGACGVEANQNRQLQRIALHVPDWSQVQWLDATPPDPFSRKPTPMADLLRFSADTPQEHRVYVRGVVTLSSRDGTVFLQDHTGGLRVRLSVTNRLEPGQVVDLLGFPVAGGFTPTLESPQFRILGTTNLPAAAEIRAEDLMQGTYEGRRVRVTGRVLEQTTGRYSLRLLLGEGETVFESRLEAPPNTLPSLNTTVGDRVEIEGVCQMRYDEDALFRSFTVLLNSPSELRVIAKAPARWMPRLLGALGALTGGLLLVLGWVASLRRRVDHQTGLIREQLTLARTLEERFRDLFENSSDLIYTLDEHQSCTSANHAARKVFGLEPEAARGRDHASFFCASAATQLRELASQLRPGETSPPLEAQVPARDDATQPRILELRIRAIAERDRVSGYQCTARDITDRRRLESQLLQAQKMESVGQLAAGVAHDYNNLLTVVRGHLDLLRQDPTLAPGLHESVDESIRAVHRAANLTRQLLAFSRRQVLQVQLLDLNLLVRHLVTMLQRLLPENVELQLDLNAPAATVRADPGMLEQVIVNLCVNARDAMPKGGRLTLRTERRTIEPAHVRQNPEAQPGDHLCLSVQDNGCGMDPHTLKHAFEPFFTTKNVGHGTGLGLSTVLGIVDQHRGWIEVDSQPGRGTLFQVFLPASSEAAPPPQPSAPTAPDTHTPQRTILVVEDEPAVRALSLRVLANAGYRVLGAASGAEALQLWDAHGHDVDLLLTDMVMPGGVGGRELAQRLRQSRPSLAVIYSSGYNLEWAGKEFDDHDRSVLLPKPYLPKDLLDAVRKGLDAPT